MTVMLRSCIFSPLIFFCATFIIFLAAEAGARTDGHVNLLDVAGINRILHDPVLKKDLGNVRRQLQFPVSQKTDENWTGRWFPEKPTTTLRPSTNSSQQQIKETTSTSPPSLYLSSSILLTNDSAESWTGRWFPEKPTTLRPSTDGSQQQIKETTSTSSPSLYLTSSISLTNDSEESWTGRWFPEIPTTAVPSMGHLGKQFPKNLSLGLYPLSDSSNDSSMQFLSSLGSFISTSVETSGAESVENQRTSSQVGPYQRLSNLSSHLSGTNLHLIISPQLRNNSLISRPDESWTGKWLPPKTTTSKPRGSMQEATPLPNPNSMWQMINSSCDDGKTNLTVDWDGSPVNYTCYNPFNYIEPDHDLPNLILSYPIPKEYKAKHECMSWPIEYTVDLPTFGTHRPAWPRYGEYKFLPRQRWLHSLEHGAVVMLYHPCAHPALVNQLKELVSSCLYRHVITPYTLLNPDRPFALVTWGWALLLTSVDKHGVTNFIRKHALHGPEATSKDGQFSEGLINPAKIITDQDDSTEFGLCPQTMF